MKATTIILLIISLLGSPAIHSQDIKADTRLDTGQILLGDQIKLTLEVSIPEKASVAWPILQDTLVKNIEIIETEPIDTAFKSGLQNLKQEILITSFDSGEYTIRAFEFLYMNPDDTAPEKIYSLPQLLKVSIPEVDTAKAIKPIKPPLGAPITFGEVFPWVLLGLAVIGLVWFIIYYIKKRKKKEPVFKSKPKPKLPAHVIALNGLEELRHQKLWQNGKYKDYYTAMTDLVREYVEDRFDVRAIEMTTKEIMDGLKNKKINKEALDKLYQTLKLADKVKFAKVKPLPLENDISLNNSIDFVNETIVKVEESLNSSDNNKLDDKNKSIE